MTHHSNFRTWWWQHYAAGYYNMHLSLSIIKSQQITFKFIVLD